MSSKGGPSIPEIATKLMHDLLMGIIHETVLEKHREHKQLLASLDPSTRLPHCSTCNLPQLLDPPLALRVRGTSIDPPRDTVYCDRKPWSRRLGYDIYDNPFPKSDVTGRPPTKKEREEAKRKKEAGGDNDDANGDGGSPRSPSAEGNTANVKGEKLEKGEKKANKIDEKLKKGEYVPWHTCPSCKRSLLITRFAKHLEQCMGLSGRAASRNAMAKMNSSTPAGSRGGTPNPSQDAKGDDDDDDDIAVKASGGVRKKLLKKGYTKLMKKDKLSNGKLSKNLSAAKRPPGSSNLHASPAHSSATAGEKRERDADDDDADDNVHVLKRQKLQRVGSVASIGSASTVAHMGTLDNDVERGEADAEGDADSNDGSFVDDDGSGGDE